MQEYEFDDVLRYNMSEYKKYLDEKLEDIKNFDIWYEENTGKKFPKKWYTFIKKTNK